MSAAGMPIATPQEPTAFSNAPVMQAAPAMYAGGMSQAMPMQYMTAGAAGGVQPVTYTTQAAPVTYTMQASPMADPGQIAQAYTMPQASPVTYAAAPEAQQAMSYIQQPDGSLVQAPQYGQVDAGPMQYVQQPDGTLVQQAAQPAAAMQYVQQADGTLVQQAAAPPQSTMQYIQQADGSLLQQGAAPAAATMQYIQQADGTLVQQAMPQQAAANVQYVQQADGTIMQQAAGPSVQYVQQADGSITQQAAGASAYVQQPDGSIVARDSVMPQPVSTYTIQQPAPQQQLFSQAAPTMFQQQPAAGSISAGIPMATYAGIPGQPGGNLQQAASMVAYPGLGTATAYIAMSVQQAWENHSMAFARKDIESLMLDYDEASVVRTCDSICTKQEYRGQFQIRELYQGLIQELGPSIPEVVSNDIEEDVRQVFQCWRCPAAAYASVGETVLFSPQNKILRQTIVWNKSSMGGAAHEVNHGVQSLPSPAKDALPKAAGSKKKSSSSSSKKKKSKGIC